MQRLSRQKQSPLEFRRPTVFDELKIKLLIRSINFVARNWMAERTKMHADLVRVAGARNCANQTKFSASRSNEALLDTKLSLGRRSGGMNHLLEPNLGLSVFPLSIHRRIDNFGFPFRPAPSDR